MSARGALALAGLVLCVAILLPLGSLFTSGVSWDALADAAPWSLFARSVGVSTMVTALALGIGVPLGTVLGRSDVPGRGVLLVLHAFPVFLPPFVPALGWLALVGDRAASTSGLVLVLGVTLAPVVTALTAIGVAGVDPALEEAARSVAPASLVARRILLPAARPAVALAGVVVFALAISESGVPMLLRVRVYSAALLARLADARYAPSEALALAIPLFVVGAVVLAVERRIAGRRSLPLLGIRIRERTSLPLGRLRAPCTIFAVLAAAVSIAPLVVLAARAGARGFSAAPDWIDRSVRNGLVVSLAAAVVSTAVAVVVGRALARAEPGARALDGVAALGFLAPAAVLGLALSALWNRPWTAGIYGSLAILVVAFVARYSALAVRATAAAFRQGGPAHEESAQASGAGYLRRLSRVVVPIHARGIGAAFVLVLVFCLRDLDLAAMLRPPGGDPLAVRILTLEPNGPPRVVAALSVLHASIVAVLLAAGGALFPRART